MKVKVQRWYVMDKYGMRWGPYYEVRRYAEQSARQNTLRHWAAGPFSVGVTTWRVPSDLLRVTFDTLAPSR